MQHERVRLRAEKVFAHILQVNYQIKLNQIKNHFYKIGSRENCDLFFSRLRDCLRQHIVNSENCLRVICPYSNYSEQASTTKNSIYHQRRFNNNNSNDKLVTCKMEIDSNECDFLLKEDFNAFKTFYKRKSFHQKLLRSNQIINCQTPDCTGFFQVNLYHIFFFKCKKS